MNYPFLFVALDYHTGDEVLKIAEELAEIEENFGFKVNLDVLLKRGLGFVSELKQFERPVFADLKMLNGTRTMIEIAQRLAELNVDFINIYALAGEEAIGKVLKALQGSNTKLLGLTVLSHYDDAYCQKHFGKSLSKSVEHFATVACDAGCHGIILPGIALEDVRNLEIIKVVPGIRPSWYEDKRHAQPVTPRQAVENGANILVCGSPITKSSNTREALQKILEEIK